MYVPLCDALPAGSSLEDCSGDLACSQPTETCVEFAQAFGATGATSKEFRCVDQPGTVAAGGFCAPDGTTPGEQCETAYCLPEGDGFTGYCSRLCNTDSDCTSLGMTCQDRPLIERKSGGDVTLRVCAKSG